MLSLLQSAGDKPQGLMGHSKHFIMAYSFSSMLLFYSYLCFSVAGHSWRPEEEELTLSVSRVLEQLAEYAVCALWTAPPPPHPPTPPLLLLYCHRNPKAAPSLASAATFPLAPP